MAERAETEDAVTFLQITKKNDGFHVAPGCFLLTAHDEKPNSDSYVRRAIRAATDSNLHRSSRPARNLEGRSWTVTITCPIVV
jgi:hypothetical protein